MSGKVRLSELYSRLMGRTFTGTYEGRCKVRSMDIKLPYVTIEDCDGISDDISDILQVLQGKKVFKSIQAVPTCRIVAHEVQEAEVGDYGTYEVVDVSVFSCAAWKCPDYEVGVKIILRKEDE